MFVLIWYESDDMEDIANINDSMGDETKDDIDTDDTMK